MDVKAFKYGSNREADAYLVQSGVGIWVGGIGPMNSVKTLSNFGSAAPTFEAAENLVPKKSVVMW